MGAGLHAVKKYGGARLGDRTLIDALEPAISCLQNNEGLAAAARKARLGAEETAEMRVAHAGRSAYLGADRLLGHVDPGAAVVAELFEALAAGRGRRASA